MSDYNWLIEQFKIFGRDLFIQGVIAAHSGNMSVRVGDKMLITRSGAMLGNLTEKDVVSVNIADDSLDEQMNASREVIVHREIYRRCDTQAIVHAHTPYGIVLSLLEQEIIPVDAEGFYYYKDVPILDVKETIASPAVAQNLPALFDKSNIVMVRGHGSFAIGNTFEEAFLYTSSFANACKINYLLRAASPTIYNNVTLKNRINGGKNNETRSY